MHTKTIWEILINCAHQKQTIAEKTLAGMLGIGVEDLPQAIEPVRDYCRDNDLLPLHALIVSEREARGEGMDEAHANRVGQLIFWIFDYEWESMP